MKAFTVLQQINHTHTHTHRVTTLYVHVPVNLRPVRVMSLSNILFFSVLLKCSLAATDLSHSSRYPKKSSSNHCKKNYMIINFALQYLQLPYLQSEVIRSEGVLKDFSLVLSSYDCMLHMLQAPPSIW